MSEVIDRWPDGSPKTVSFNTGTLCPGFPTAICGIDLPHPPHLFGHTPTPPSVEAAFRAGFKAGFGSAIGWSSFNVPNDCDLYKKLKDDMEAAEDAAFKAAYPEPAD